MDGEREERPRAKRERREREREKKGLLGGTLERRGEDGKREERQEETSRVVTCTLPGERVGLQPKSPTYPGLLLLYQYLPPPSRWCLNQIKIKCFTPSEVIITCN